MSWKVWASVMLDTCRKIVWATVRSNKWHSQSQACLINASTKSMLNANKWHQSTNNFLVQINASAHHHSAAHQPEPTGILASSPPDLTNIDNRLELNLDPLRVHYTHWSQTANGNATSSRLLTMLLDILLYFSFMFFYSMLRIVSCVLYWSLLRLAAIKANFTSSEVAHSLLDFLRVTLNVLNVIRLTCSDCASVVPSDTFRLRWDWYSKFRKVASLLY